MQCARLGSFPGTVGPGGPQMGDRSELAVWGDGFGVYKQKKIFLELRLPPEHRTSERTPPLFDLDPRLPTIARRDPEQSAPPCALPPPRALAAWGHLSWLSPA